LEKKKKKWRGKEIGGFYAPELIRPEKRSSCSPGKKVLWEERGGEKKRFVAIHLRHVRTGIIEGEGLVAGGSRILPSHAAQKRGKGGGRELLRSSLLGAGGITTILEKHHLLERGGKEKNNFLCPPASRGEKG